MLNYTNVQFLIDSGIVIQNNQSSTDSDTGNLVDSLHYHSRRLAYKIHAVRYDRHPPQQKGVQQPAYIISYIVLQRGTSMLWTHLKREEFYICIFISHAYFDGYQIVAVSFIAEFSFQFCCFVFDIIIII